MEKKTRRIIEEFIRKQGTEELTLDIGSGDRPYLKYFPNSISVDVKGDPDISGDVHDLPFMDNTFNAILASEMLEHCKDPQNALNEMARVLKKGGKIILTTRFVFPHHAPPDYFRFSSLGMQTLAEKAGLKVQVLEEEKAFSELFHRFEFASSRMRKLIFLTMMIILRNLDDALPTTGIYVVLTH